LQIANGLLVVRTGKLVNMLDTAALEDPSEMETVMVGSTPLVVVLIHVRLTIVMEAIVSALALPVAIVMMNVVYVVELVY
jgi:hypothetical protein